MENEARRCKRCGRRYDRPSFYSECAKDHPSPTTPEIIAEAVEDVINSRKGLGWRHLDDEIVDEIRDDLAVAVKKVLDGSGRLE